MEKKEILMSSCYPGQDSHLISRSGDRGSARIASAILTVGINEQLLLLSFVTTIRIEII